jgi:hypothetical protein
MIEQMADHLERTRKPPIHYRNRVTVAAIFGYILDAEQPVHWLEVIDVFTSDTIAWRTVERILHELMEHGAIHRIGQAGNNRRADTRAVKVTVLGHAWFNQELSPYIGQWNNDQAAEDDPGED